MLLNLQVLWKFLQALHLQVTTFFKYWLNTSEYYHNTYEYCHNTSKYFAGEYTPRTLQFFISVLRILFVKGYCLKCLELDNWTKLKLVKWINYNPIWHLVSLHHIWFTDIIRKHIHFKLIMHIIYVSSLKYRMGRL